MIGFLKISTGDFLDAHQMPGMKEASNSRGVFRHAKTKGNGKFRTQVEVGHKGTSSLGRRRLRQKRSRRRQKKMNTQVQVMMTNL
jgi:hypothetical protein